MGNSSTGSPGVFSPAVLIRLLLIFLPAAALTGGVVMALYRHDIANEQARYELAGTHLVKLQAEIIKRELKTVQSDLFYLANQEVLIDFLTGGPTHKEQLEQEYSLFARYRGVYDQIRFLDVTGQERIRINSVGDKCVVVPASELQSKAKRYYFFGTMRLGRNEVFISPLDLNVEHDKIEVPHKPVIRFATPVFDRKGQKKGILVLNYLGEALIMKLAEVAVTFPGSTLLLSADGYYLRGLTRQDEWGFMLGHNRSFASDFPEAWQRFGRAGTNQFATDLGLFTARTLRPESAIPAVTTANPPSNQSPDRDAEDPSFIVVSHIQADVLGWHSTLLFERLLMLAAVVVQLLFALAWYLAYAGAWRRSQERRLADSEARLRVLSSQLIAAQETERRKLSRDMHDELGQLVTAVTLDLQRAAQTGQVEKKDELIGRGLHGAGLLLKSIQEIAARIRPTLLDDLGLKDAAQNLLSDFERRTGIAPRSEIDLDGQELPPVIAENVYRIIQEALNNITRHAQSEEVFVELRAQGRKVSLAVRDAGAGFSPDGAAGQGLGLLGMRERAELLDGDFTVKSAPGQGTEIRVNIPIPK